MVQKYSLAKNLPLKSFYFIKKVNDSKNKKQNNSSLIYYAF